MAFDENKRRARWSRNKRAERERKRPSPRPLSPEFARTVWEERDRRVAAAYRGIWCWPESRYLSGERLGRAVELAADVWAADILFAARWGKRDAPTAAIFKTLIKTGRTHGYTDGSLRKSIAKARERVKLLETTAEPWRPDEVSWPEFRVEDTPDNKKSL